MAKYTKKDLESINKQYKKTFKTSGCRILSNEEMQAFRQVYGQVNDEFKLLKNDRNYQKLSMEEKAKVVKKLADLYFDKASGQGTSKLSRLVSKNVPVYKYLILMGELQLLSLSEIPGYL